MEARRTLLAVAKAKSEQFPLEGKRLVSEREWHLLQEEVSGAGTRTVGFGDVGEDVAWGLRVRRGMGRVGVKRFVHLGLSFGVRGGGGSVLGSGQLCCQKRFVLSMSLPSSLTQ